MDKQNQKAEIMTLISEELDAWLDQSVLITDGYEYETAFIEFSRKLSTILLEKSIGDQYLNHISVDKKSHVK